MQVVHERVLAGLLPRRGCGRQAWLEEKVGCNTDASEASTGPVGSAGAGVVLLICAELRQRGWALEVGFPREGI